MKKYVYLFLAAIFLMTTGCGTTATDSAGAASANAGAAQSATGSASSSKAVTITDFAGRQISFNTVPQKIVALSNGEMNIVYALGGELVGRPTATGPISVKAAEKVEQVGSTHGMILEKVAYLSPEVVLGNNPLNTKDIASVESIGAKMVLTQANSIDDVKKQIQLFGQMLQKSDKAAELNASIDAKIKAAETGQSSAKPRVLMVYGAPGTYMAALNNSLSGDILVKAGGVNIAADYPALDQYPQYAQLNTEKIIKSNPQLIVIMSHGNTEKSKEGFIKEMQQNPAWNSLDAVKNNHVEVLPSDLFGTNPGTDVVDALDLMKKLLDAAK
ncbi:ABC transporter substrate-binding protein [Paenibacillus thalictri]|uniref:ABC transporter substrate-binding protein n=1 Tax=Paenibacillus thalictri TaxID=2527873 RepID=A0A4Q9DLP6_9BACL|nr:ABC transporter substrate-binding protein [Paenibacillus thalictri]TBL73912.1 ABC transporter substrate-binding protein [Paenibacillus thalictri]